MTLDRIKKRSFVFTMLMLLAVLLAVPAAAADVPEWVQNFNFKGDLRLRYQAEDDNANGDQRQRFRMRFRPGVTAKITDQWSVGFGLATGGSDLRSTNQTFSEFSTYDIRLDYAYAEYSPSESVKITAGKMKTPFYTAKDLLWDGDNRPDGAAANLTFETSDNLTWFVTPGLFVLGEYRESRGDENFEMMQVLQGGIDTKLSESAYLKAAATAFFFNDIVPGTFEQSAGTNTEAIDSALALDAEFGFTGAPVFIGAFGQFVSSDADAEETGYLMGVKFGDKSVKTLGQWQVKYSYRSLEANAFQDFLTDSDALGGATGIEGSEIEVVAGLAKNVTFGIDYYMTKDKQSNEELDLIQVDLVVKF